MTRRWLIDGAGPGSPKGLFAGSTRVGATSVVLSTALALIPVPAVAQDAPGERRDSLPVVKLTEVVISAPSVAPGPAFTLTAVPVAEIESRGAASVSQLAALVPAAHVQTNSRGETLVYLRNAGERQVAVLFDGALLNVPWDNRVDMSMVPAGIVGGLSIAKGVPSVEYGANVVGGAINVTSRLFERTLRPVTVVETAYGSEARVRTLVSHRGSRGPAAWAGSVGYVSADATRLAGGALLPYSQPDPTRRTNSDSRIGNGFARGTYRFDDGTEIGVSLIHVDAEKGVPPEGHLDPAASRVRFWRYPVWRSSQLILGGEGILSGLTRWKGTVWASRFQQTIDQYASAGFDTFDAREEGHDVTLGGRLVALRQLGAGMAKFAFNGVTSTHRQRDLALLADGQAAPGASPTLRYRQHIVSAGAEYELRPARAVTVTAGASYDVALSPLTGDKPARDPFRDVTATLGATLDRGRGWFARAAVGRKTRFPTMRELFGEALDRFLLSQDLRPESSILAELGLGVRSAALSGEIIPFASFTSNTIDQQSVLLAGETTARRQRVNLPGSRVLGVEVVGAGGPHPDVRIEGHLTLMHVRRRQSGPTDPLFLSEKPNAIGRLAVSFAPPAGPRVSLETAYTGRAYSLDDANRFVPLTRSLVLNGRLGYRMAVDGDRSLEFFAQVENLTDEVVEPQLGLPAPGRSYQGGLRAEL